MTKLEQKISLQFLKDMRRDEDRQQQKSVDAFQLRINQITERVTRLTDAYIDRLIDKDLFEERKTTLFMERRDAEDQLKEWQSGKRNLADEFQQLLERAETAYVSYNSGDLLDKRDLVDSITSNLVVDQKLPTISLVLPFSEIANRLQRQDGSPRRDTHLIWKHLFGTLEQHIRKQWSESDRQERLSSAA